MEFLNKTCCVKSSHLWVCWRHVPQQTWEENLVLSRKLGFLQRQRRRMAASIFQGLLSPSLMLRIMSSNSKRQNTVDVLIMDTCGDYFTIFMVWCRSICIFLFVCPIPLYVWLTNLVTVCILHLIPAPAVAAQFKFQFSEQLTTKLGHHLIMMMMRNIIDHFHDIVFNKEVWLQKSKQRRSKSGQLVKNQSRTFNASLIQNF